MSTFSPDLQPPPRLAWGMWKRFLLAALLIVFATTGGVATAVLLEVDSAVKIFRAASGQPIPGIDDVLDDVDPGQPQTLLLLGSDERYIDRVEGNPTRSDTMILVRLDPEKEVTSMISIPRDLKATIPGPEGRFEDKINVAYAVGGPRLAVRTVRELFDMPIHHVVNVNFGGFRRAVERLGCVYTDVDRRYFNDNDPPVDSPTNYATIDIKPGYQKLCGQDSLDYVRYRHNDTDVVRNARQQDWLGEAKDQIGVDRLFSDRDELLRIFGRYTETDIRSTAAILRLLKLSYEASRNPIRTVRFRGEVGETFITVDEDNVARMREEFLEGSKPSGAKGQARKEKGRSSDKPRKRPKVAPGLEDATKPGQDQAVAAAVKLRFPVYYPEYRVTGSQYVELPRTYDIYDRDKRKHRAYRMVVKKEGVGEYYGIQGMTWKDPPILANPSEERKVDGRTLMLYFDGDRLSRVAWRTDKAVYWVSNTLLRSLSNRQMLGIAGSLTRMNG